MTRELIAALVISLAATLIIEAGFYLLIMPRTTKDLLLVCAVNIVTNPAVVLLFWLSVFYIDLNRVIIIAALELSAVYAEGHYYKKYGRNFKHPYLFSIAANATSFGIGIIFQHFI